MWSILVSTLALAAAGAAVPEAADDPKPPCCFTNPQYTGVCSVQPSADETCGDILEFLNAPQSQGKSYCGNTTVRGGWEPTRCEPAAPPQP